MDVQEFWNLIEPGKNTDEPEIHLKTELENLSAEKLELFQLHFDGRVDESYSWALWGAAYLIHGGCSDDGFIDFRYSLVSKGKEVYESAIADPDSLSQFGEDLEMENELYGYVAAELYESKTGKEIPRHESKAPPEPLGQEWDFDDGAENKKRLPKLYSIFGE